MNILLYKEYVTVKRLKQNKLIDDVFCIKNEEHCIIVSSALIIDTFIQNKNLKKYLYLS